MKRSVFVAGRWKIAFAIAVCFVIGWVIVQMLGSQLGAGHHDSPRPHDPISTTVSAGQLGPSTSALKVEQVRRESTYSWPSASRSSSSTAHGINAINSLRTGRELVEYARRTDDPNLQLYTLWGASHVCKAFAFMTQDLKRFAAFGAAHPEQTERILSQLMQESDTAAAGVRERCAEFETSDSLRNALIDEASRKRLPLFLAQDALAALQREPRTDASKVNEARARLAEAVDGSQPATMVLLLSRSLEGAGRSRMASEFPATSVDDWPLGPLAAAFQIAACRTREIDCGPGSLARDSVCARFGECQASTLEASYRRLFELYAIPFADTDRLANKLATAISARNVQQLLN